MLVLPLSQRYIFFFRLSARAFVGLLRWLKHDELCTIGKKKGGGAKREYGAMHSAGVDSPSCVGLLACSLTQGVALASRDVAGPGKGARPREHAIPTGRQQAGSRRRGPLFDMPTSHLVVVRRLLWNT